MVSGINNVEQTFFQPRGTQRASSSAESRAYINSFDIEDEAIISEQSKLLNELEKFNAGESSPIDLAMANIRAKTTVSALSKVIQTKIDMYDTVLNIGR